MTATQDDTIAELQRANAELRREREAGRAREATLAEQLAARDAALAQRNSEYVEQIEHQLATVDVLSAMSESPGDPQPVFVLITRHASECCKSRAVLWEFDGKLMHFRASHGAGYDLEAQEAIIRQFPAPPDRGVISARAVLEQRLIHIADATEDPEIWPLLIANGARSYAAIPLMRDGKAIGAISMNSPVAGGFSESQIELLTTFAEQAVIAITSAETYLALQTRTSDLQETLEYQTATSNVLKVISQSTFDLQPVLDTVVETAARLCNAEQAVMSRREGEFIRLVANYGFPPEYWAHQRAQGLIPIDHNSESVGLRTIAEGGRIVHVHDVAAVPNYPEFAVRLGRQRTSLGVPLMREGEVIGAILLARQRVEPFTDRQIDLVRTFADQAVIAIENTRLITEQREALEQQTATAEVLQVINASPGDLKPVFDAMLEKAMHLCGAAFGQLHTYDGEGFPTASLRGLPAEYAEYQAKNPPTYGPGTAPWRIVHGEHIVHLVDLAKSDLYRAGDAARRATVDLGGCHTLLTVALRREDTLLGIVSLYRQEVRPFTDKQVALLQNFAAQAVIAIENARLITEQREALEQQTATAEVLQVINDSPGDLAPVFEAMLEKAMRLCGAAFGSLYTYDGARFHTAAQRGVPAAFAEIRMKSPPVSPPGSPIARSYEAKRSIQVLDVMAGNDYQAGQPTIRELVDVGGVRTLLVVPLFKDETPLGHFALYRQKVLAFSGKQIALLENFAAQAVIAMENARLITEQREALEQQTATAEVLQVINASPGDLAPVFDAMLEKAMRLCGAAYGVLRSFDGKVVRILGSHGVPPAYAEFLARNAGTPAQGSGVLRALQTGRPAQTLDAKESVGYKSGAPGGRAIVDLGGARTVLHVPLVKDQVSVGLFTFYRREVRGFSDKQIALLENFAAQAVIAMENARLLTEQQEALEQQTATAEVLQVINTSPGNLAPVFDAILEKAHRLCGATHGSLHLFDGEKFRAVATYGISEVWAERTRDGLPAVNNPVTEPLLDGARLVHIADMVDINHPLARVAAEATGVRTALFVPLRKDNRLIGAISALRREVRPFTEKEIALLENFAAQAVIAMENARLLTETREALEQQTATAEVLQVINASPGDLVPVFDTILDKAMRLCEAAFGGLFTYDGESFHTVAALGTPAALTEFRTRNPPSPLPGSTSARLLETRRTHHILDRAEEPDYLAGEAGARAMVELGGARSMLNVPLIKDDNLLAYISIYRQEVRPFSDKQIALLENFAAQAVIAMENARLITEQREALEQQTATADVLQVINANPGNLAPVFDAILEKAHSLCGVALGELELHEGGKFRAVAMRGVSGPLAELLRQPFTPPPNSPLARLLAGEPVVQIADLFELAQQRPDDRRAQAGAQYGLRTVLFLPLRKDDALLGYITAYRQEVRPFSEKEIALLQNFAAQAVIAMENTRLITEISEALEQQTATAEVLQVINASPGDLMPVFDAILEKAHALCGAATGSLQLYDGEFFRAVATRGLPDEFANILQQPRSGLHDALLRDAPFVQITDIADPVLTGGDKTLAVAHDLAGVRTHLRVPLRKDDALLGLIVAGRREVRPFSQKEILLLQSFAAQAVIAMENARLLNEIRQRQAELRTTFDNMGDGVAMFDTDLRLAAWNRNFQQIIDLPDTILETRPSYADYLRLLAERGEFGTTDIEAELSLRIEDTDKELRLERMRPDGRVIEVRRNAVPGGGFVLIYSDITERKHSEEEIRAARDAAEIALRELRTAQANLIQAEKMASLGQLTAGIAHEIKNPLNFVNNFSALSTELIDELRDVLAPEPLGETARTEVDGLTALLKGNLEKVVQHGQRADGIVRSMLDHSRGSAGERRMVDLNALIDEALNLAYHGARAQDQSFNITLERDFGEAIAPIEVNPQDITRVFLNIFANGFYATTKRARDDGDAGFEPTLKVATRDAGDAVEIRVRDNGTGIPTDIRDKLFQPFFTTKPTGEGTGLGLSITYDIVTQQHGGSIAVDSKVGEYSEFTVRLPRGP